MRWYVLAVLALSSALLRGQQRDLLYVERSEVSFLSDAAMELISATNTGATGVLDVHARTFAVKIPMRLFTGFNSALQKEHFNENYVESTTWPHALFEGRVIEASDLHKPATYRVRAKGRFTLHGVTKERIISCTIVVEPDGDVHVTGQFDVLLSDHGIRIPRVVQQKLAEQIKVRVDLLFTEAKSP